MSNSNPKKDRRTISRREFIRSSVVGGAAVAVAACAPAAPGGGSTGATSSDESMASDGPMQGGTLVWMGHQEVSGLGPNDAGPTVHWAMILNIHNSLVLLDENIVFQTILADSYEVSDDGLTYTFALREGVKFHDDKEFTSADVKYTYDFYRQEGNTIAGSFLGVDSVDTPDDYTVVVNMSQVNAASISNWASTFIVQGEYHAEVGEDVYRTAPIGTGAFKLKEWRAAEFTELEAFDDHFRGRPNIDILRQDVVPEPSVRYLALTTGDADSAVWPLLVEDSLELDAGDDFTVFRTLANSIKHFPLNNSIPQLAEKEVRQAMMHALDRQRIIDDLWNGAAQISHSNLGPKNAAYHKTDTKQYDFDPEKAKAMLDEAGWAEGSDGIREKDGVQLSFTCTTITGDQARRPIAELAQQFLADVGIDMQLAEAPVAAILEGMRGGTMDASLFNWTYGTTPEPDPFSTLHPDGGNNFCQYDNPRMTELIETGTTFVSEDERRPIYHEIQDIFVEEVPALYLQFDEWMNPWSSRVKGLPESPLGGDRLWIKAHEIWLEG
ncbi:MAG: ABC transporter substrate-binding protein [Chloroflexota bacterium]